MENQHRKIKGYKDLSQENINLINKIKMKSNEVGILINELNENIELDKRWIDIGRTDLQKGFMALVRSVAKPNFF